MENFTLTCPHSVEFPEETNAVDYFLNRVEKYVAEGKTYYMVSNSFKKL